MVKRLLVTGYGGFVAGSVVKQAGAGWDVIALSRSRITRSLPLPTGEGRGEGELPNSNAPSPCPLPRGEGFVTGSCGREGITTFQFDLREIGRLRQVFEEVQPAAVIHTAAMANIDRCQSHQEEAETINVGVTGHLAELCRQHGARMVFCSTDTVFDGKQGMYVEADVPRPLNYYAETKVRAEQIVRAELDDMVVARLSLVIGFPLIGAGNSFLAHMTASFQQGTSVPVPENEIRTPVDVVTLGRALLELADSDFTGILHLAGNTRLNRYEMAVQIAELLGFPRDLVNLTNSNAMSDRAPRPNDASLDNSKAKHVLTTPMLDLSEGLGLILETAEK